MLDGLTMHRWHFAFTITYHYLFPQLTMGLALLIVILKSLALKTKDPLYEDAARFWVRIFGINFVFGVVTGIPMEFQFGTNWANFSKAAGGVIGQTLAMEGVFAFFLESSLLGLLIYGEKRLSPILHWLAAFGVFVGSWVSGFFIVATNAWMQHPVGYEVAADGSLHLNNFWALLTNPWLVWQYTHTMIASVCTAAFVMGAVGAYYVIQGQHRVQGMLFLKFAIIGGFISSLMLPFPTGDMQAKMLYKNQGPAFAAMEGLFESEPNAPIVLIGQPDVQKRTIDNPIYVPGMLSFLTYGRWDAEVKGLNEFPEEDWPDNIPLLYYAYHIMAGLGTIMIAVTGVGLLLLLFKKLEGANWWMWIMLLCFPFPYIANTAGWMTAELGRQPWVIYGLMRTADGSSENVSSGNTLWSLLGFMGMYSLLSILFVILITYQIGRGPGAADAHEEKGGAEA